jgi:hypothetical protein
MTKYSETAKRSVSPRLMPVGKYRRNRRKKTPILATERSIPRVAIPAGVPPKTRALTYSK